MISQLGITTCMRFDQLVALVGKEDASYVLFWMVMAFEDVPGLSEDFPKIIDFLHREIVQKMK